MAIFRRWRNRGSGSGRRRAPITEITTLAPARYDVRMLGQRQYGLAEVDRHINSLSPNGIDEGTGHAVDRLVDAWARQWTSEVDVAHLDGQTTVDALVADGARTEMRLRLMLEAEQDQLELLREAVQRCRERLAGRDDR